MRVLLLMLVSCLMLSCSQPAPEQSYHWPVLDGFPKPQVPQDNPMTKEKVALGRVIFYDTGLSANGSQSCASCHQQQYAFAEPKKVSIGSTGQAHTRNAPALVNIAYNKTLTWAHDGLTNLETQLLLPMFGEQPIELGITFHEQQVLSRFNNEKYRALFQAAFPQQPISFELIVKALASFTRSLISLQAPFDRYAYANDDDAISAEAIRGMQLFFSERLECHHCHGGFNFTQSTFHEQQLIDRRPFHNTGLYNIAEQGYPALDTGLQAVTSLAQDNGRFRAPTLRNIAVSAPYMHDGSIATLEQVLDFYAAGGRVTSSGAFAGDGRVNPLKSPLMKGFEMTEQDKQDLLAFLATLTDQQFLTNADFAAPEQ